MYDIKNQESYIESCCTDNISGNIETTYNDVEQGNAQLRQAGVYAVFSKVLKFFYILIFNSYYIFF